MSDILEFINVFNSDSNKLLFTDTACYWFSVILNKRFKNSRIVYNPHQVHFATKIVDKVYDITGEIKETSDYVDWNYYSSYADDVDMIYRYCIRLERR